MSKNFKIFITGIYLAICVGISGNYYINPTITYDFIKVTTVNQWKEPTGFKNFYDVEIDKKKLLNSKSVRITEEHISYKKSKYSLLYSFIGLIILVSFLQLYHKK
ncbi:hypothetical protein [Flavobacterium sp.]|uniref:hypothetical protein n=1 Tax=Flavobacterium sp. TaxID=239 RepID=UPI0040479592